MMLTCCEIIPLTKLRKGSISSANPSGENTWHGCWSMTDFSFGAVLMRCSKASARIFPVVVLIFETLDGDTWFRGLVVTRWRVSGETRGALVPLGTVRRLSGGGALSSISPDEYGADINPTAAGVGVTGGRIDFVARFLFGVDGPVSVPFGRDSAGILFLFLLVFANFGGGSTAAFSLFTGKIALKRADLLEDITIDLEWKIRFNGDVPQNCGARDFCSPKRWKRMAAVVFCLYEGQLLALKSIQCREYDDMCSRRSPAP
jgi:hypothetical protein